VVDATDKRDAARRLVAVPSQCLSDEYGCYVPVPPVPRHFFGNDWNRTSVPHVQRVSGERPSAHKETAFEY
jgi:hypothetical protein